MLTGSFYSISFDVDRLLLLQLLDVDGLLLVVVPVQLGGGCDGLSLLVWRHLAQHDVLL